MTMTSQPRPPSRISIGDAEEELRAAIASKNYVRAAMLAERLRRPWEETRRLQELALERMACDYRNAVATHNLARQWGFSRADVKAVLDAALEEHDSRSARIQSKRCYDAATGEYLTLRQWVGQLLRTWQGH